MMSMVEKIQGEIMNKQIIKELRYIYSSFMDDMSKKLYIN